MAGGCHLPAEQFFNLIFGYSDRYDEDLSQVAAGATVICIGSTVPPGEAWVIQAIWGTDGNRAATGVYLEIMSPGTIGILKHEVPAAAGRFVTWSGQAVLKETDKVRIVVTGCVAGDTISAGTWGYKMKLDY